MGDVGSGRMSGEVGARCARRVVSAIRPFGPSAIGKPSGRDLGSCWVGELAVQVEQGRQMDEM